MALEIEALRCEHATDPLGIDERRPRLGWRLRSDRRSTLQAGYRIQVAARREDLEAERALRWDTGEVESDRSIHVVYGGPELQSFERCFWRVRVRDDRGETSPWSEPACFEMGILEPDTWQAEWIEPDLEERGADDPCPMLRREFSLRGPVRSARAYVTALGLYEMEINGRRVGSLRLTPGFTSFARRLHYQVYDVTALLAPGANAVGVTLADGWYRGPLWFRARRNVFGSKLALLAELRMEYADGGRERVASDASWRCATGAVRSSDLYFGEVQDARLEIPGWSRPGLPAEVALRGVRRLDHSRDLLRCSPAPPVRATEELRPREILRTPRGELVVDFGQVIAGVVRLELEGPRGREVTLRHCEELTPEGNFNAAQLDLLGLQRRSGRYTQVDRYVLKGEGREIFEPRFTFHGFRYVALEGLPGPLDPERITALVIRSDLPETGEFSCSSPDLDRLHANIVWSQKANFLEIPTDCPQREKMGWTGDIQIYASTACFLMDAAGFLTKWLLDLRADQREDGLVPHVIPWLPDYPVFPRMGMGGSAGWGDACTVVPWTLYRNYADERILAAMYGTMKRWLAFIASRARGFVWSRGMHWGDWLEPGRSGLHYFLPWRRKGHVATPFFAHSAELTARVAERLGEAGEAEGFRALARQVKEAYRRRYVGRDGRIRPSTQGAYVLALAFDMVPPELAPRLAAHLADLVRRNGCRLATGFLSTAHLCPVLSRYGYEDLAFSLLNQEAPPSWLYQVGQGATTVWEEWDAKRPDGSLHRGMSFNHYAFGAIGDWLYRHVAGIDTDEDRPGFAHSRLAPHPGGGLEWARARHLSPYGEVAVAWRRGDGELTVEVRVPPNTTASLRLPGAVASEVLEAGLPLAQVEGVAEFGQEEAAVRIALGSGRYAFRYPA